MFAERRYFYVLNLAACVLQVETRPYAVNRNHTCTSYNMYVCMYVDARIHMPYTKNVDAKFSSAMICEVQCELISNTGGWKIAI